LSNEFDEINLISRLIYISAAEDENKILIAYFILPKNRPFGDILAYGKKLSFSFG